MNSKSIKLIKASDEIRLYNGSKLVVVSDSVQNNITEKLQSDAKKANVPTMHFNGSSVSLGKLCGLQFRVSTVSFNSLSDSNIKSILKEAEKN